jgi:hypothetical protein
MRSFLVGAQGQLMARIPMKGDPPSLQQIVEKYGHPADHMARSYFEAFSRADELELAGEWDEALAFRQVAKGCRKDLAKYGFVSLCTHSIHSIS